MSEEVVEQIVTYGMRHPKRVIATGSVGFIVAVWCSNALHTIRAKPQDEQNNLVLYNVLLWIGVALVTIALLYGGLYLWSRSRSRRGGKAL